MKTLHTAYRVTDLVASLEFYTALGYREVGRVGLDGVPERAHPTESHKHGDGPVRCVEGTTQRTRHGAVVRTLAFQPPKMGVNRQSSLSQKADRRAPPACPSRASKPQRRSVVTS